ncbi:MAG: 30S ribosomal protein S9 [bacterium]|nr:30S ribosomal protein S9 [bacterium]
MTTTPKETARYIETIGRRKTAVARVRLWPGKKGSIVVNDKKMADHFQDTEFQDIVLEAFQKTHLDGPFETSVVVKGGGIHAQAEATRHGIARALFEYDNTLRPQLKKLGMLMRDPRMRERKKFGLKRARKAPQWRKR